MTIQEIEQSIKDISLIPEKVSATIEAIDDLDEGDKKDILTVRLIRAVSKMDSDADKFFG